MKVGASDVHLKVSRTPVYRLNGKLIQLKQGPVVTHEQLEKIAYDMMNEKQRAGFEKYYEMDFAYSSSGI